MHDRIELSVTDGVADVRLNRPDKLNALDPAMFDALIDAIDRLGAMADVRAVVLSGAGRGFCAGLDMASMAGGVGAALNDPVHGIANRYQQVAWGWRTLPMPVVAALHGPVLGGGLQIAGGADIRIAAPDARLSVMELKWGIVPDMGGHALWRGVVRADVLRECTYTARQFDGAEAERLGFVTRIAADPLTEAMATARTIAAQNPDAIRAAKRLAALMTAPDAGAILAAEAREQAALIGSANQMEAVRAALSNRAPVFVDQPIV